MTQMKLILFRIAHFYCLFAWLGLLITSPCQLHAQTNEIKNAYFTDKNSGLRLPIPDGFRLGKATDPNIIAILSPKNEFFPQLNIIRAEINSARLPNSATDWATIVKDDYAKVGITKIEIVSTEEIKVSGKSKAFKCEVRYMSSDQEVSSYVILVPEKNISLVVTYKDLSVLFQERLFFFNAVWKEIQVPDNSETYKKTGTNFTLIVCLILLTVLGILLYFKKS